MKKALVLRWGGWGDLVQSSILFPVIKEDGYHLTVNTTERGLEVIREDPNIDSIQIYEEDSIPNEQLLGYWKQISAGYDKFINLSESIEGSLLLAEGRQDFNLPKSERLKLGDVNYFDRQFDVAGYPDITGRNPKVYYTSFEHRIAKQERKKYGDNFVVMWALSGSSMHKSYPYTEYVLLKLMKAYDDISVIFVGDIVCQLLFSRDFFRNIGAERRVKNTCGQWGIRRSLAMTEYVDLIVGPETGILNAAGGLEVPKIIFLSHSTHENLSKYWKNVTPLFSNVACYPCHQLHYSLQSCVLDHDLGIPICMSKLEAKVVYNEIEKAYLGWKNEKSAHRNNRRRFA